MRFYEMYFVRNDEIKMLNKKKTIWRTRRTSYPLPQGHRFGVLKIHGVPRKGKTLK